MDDFDFDNDFLSKEYLENYFEDDQPQLITSDYQGFLRSDLESLFLSPLERFKVKVNSELDKLKEETGRTKALISVRVDDLEEKLDEQGLRIEELNPELTVKIILFKMKGGDMGLFSRKEDVDQADLLRYDRFLSSL
jgi:hypothetical protein